MGRKIYYLSTCDTNRRIMNELELKDFEKQDIKKEPITPDQIDEMIEMARGVHTLFSKRARKYREYGLSNKDLTEKEMRDLILEEYTFLNRPVIIIDDQIFSGSSKSTIEKVKEYLKSH
jgi:arsenate reductase (glutaredoxin)